ncbi:hypothetical protein [Psychrobacter sp. AOP31-A1-22]
MYISLDDILAICLGAGALYVCYHFLMAFFSVLAALTNIITAI